MVAVSVIGVGAAVTSQFGQASFAAGRLAAARRKWPGLVSSGVGRKPTRHRFRRASLRRRPAAN